MARAHWSDKYVNLPYVPGVFDCASLAELVQKEVFGKTLNLPKDRVYTCADSRAEKWAAMDAQINQLRDDFAVKVDVPQDGDAVLIKLRGYPQHIGVYCLIAREGWLLHANESFQRTVRTRMSGLFVRSMSVEGYYRWI